MSRPHALSLAVALVFPLLTAAHAPAQPADGDPAQPRAEQPAEPGTGESGSPRALRELTAHRLAELARSLLSEPRPDHPDRLAAARTLLGHATELDPENPQLLRLHLEALRAAEDTASERRAGLRRYLSLRPADDVAQLEFVDLLAERAQTVERRLQIYERMLSGDRARQLSAPLRSRIAMRAADLHRQRGEDEQFGERLKQAIRLDPTNRRACAAAYSLLQQRGASTVDRARALLNLVSADPSDGNLHAELARMLLRCGQYEPAARWYGSASRLWEHQGFPRPPEMIDAVRGRALALWGDGRPERAVGYLRSFAPRTADRPENGQSQPEQPEAPQPDQSDQPDQPNGADAANSDAEKPNQPSNGTSTDGLPPRLQMILVAILEQQQRTEEADEAFSQLTRTLLRPEESEDPAPDRLADFIWAHLLFDRELDGIEARLQQLEEALGEDEPLMVRLHGWWNLRRGNEEQARELLRQGAEEGDPVARYGLVLLDEQTGQSGNEAERPRFQRLNEIYAQAPDTLIGVLAARRLGRTDARPQASEACQSVGRLAGQLPPLIRRIAQQPARVVTLEAEPEQTRLDYIEPLRMTFTLTNVSPIPLSLGAGGTVPATVLVRPRVTIGGRSGPILAPQVVDLDRRIRLQSGESLTVTTRLDLGPVAEVLRQNPVPEIELRFTATLNPRPAGGRDRYEPGLLGLRVPGGRVTRTGSPNTPDAVQRSLRTLSTAEPGESMRFAALLLQIVPSLPEAQADRVRQIAEAVRGVFEDASPAGRAWLLSHLPRTERHQQAFAPMYDAAVNAENPLPLQALLAAAVDREEMTVLNAALRRPDGEAARQFAERIRSIRQLRAEARQQPAEGGATSEAEGEQGDSGDGAADSGNGGG